MAFNEIDEFKWNGFVGEVARTGLSLDYNDQTYTPHYNECAGFEKAAEHSGVTGLNPSYFKEQGDDLEKEDAGDTTVKLVPAHKVHSDWRTRATAGSGAAYFVVKSQLNSDDSEPVKYKVSGTPLRALYQPRGYAPGKTRRIVYTSGGGTFSTNAFYATLGHRIYFFHALMTGGGGNGGVGNASYGGGGGGGGGAVIGGFSFPCYITTTKTFASVGYNVGGVGGYSGITYSSIEGFSGNVRGSGASSGVNRYGGSGGGTLVTWSQGSPPRAVVLWQKTVTGANGGNGGVGSGSTGAAGGTPTIGTIKTGLVGTESFVESDTQYEVQSSNGGTGGGPGGYPIEYPGGGGGGGAMCANINGTYTKLAGVGNGGNSHINCGGGGGGGGSGIYPPGDAPEPYYPPGTGSVGLLILYY